MDRATKEIYWKVKEDRKTNFKVSEKKIHTGMSENSKITWNVRGEKERKKENKDSERVAIKLYGKAYPRFSYSSSSSVPNFCYFGRGGEWKREI